MAGTACGMMVCGWTIRALQDIHGWSVIQSYRAIFFIYAGIGLIKFILACLLSSKVEADKPEVVPSSGTGNTETTPLLQDENAATTSKKSPARSLLPSISRESWWTVGWLAVLFGLDNAASGLAPLYADCPFLSRLMY